MNEPANLTAWVDKQGDTWVRVDDARGRFGSWWCLCDGPGWEVRVRGEVGGSRDWEFVSDYGPFVKADAALTAMAVARVRKEIDR